MWKYELESRLPGEISVASDTQITPPLWQNRRSTKESLDESKRGEWKSWLKIQHSKNKDNGIRSHHLMSKKMGKQWKQWETIFLGSKITVNGDCGHETKRHLLLGRKAMTNLGSLGLKKQRLYFADKGPSGQNYAFSSRHVWMWELDHKESWGPKDAFELLC